MSPRKRSWEWLFCLACFVGSLCVPRTFAAPAPKADTVKARAAYGNLPLSFEPNQGQTDARVRFLSRGQGYTFLAHPHRGRCRPPRTDGKAPGKVAFPEAAAGPVNCCAHEAGRGELGGGNESARTAAWQKETTSSATIRCNCAPAFRITAKWRPETFIPALISTTGLIPVPAVANIEGEAYSLRPRTQIEELFNAIKT